MALALSHAVLRRVPLLGKAAGALEEPQVVVVLPGNDGILMDAVQGPYQLHAGKILAVELGRHRLELGAVKQAQERGLHHIGKMVAQSDLVAAQFPRFGVQEPPAHPGAEVAGIFVHLDGDVEDVAVKNGDGNAQRPGVLLNQRPVLRVVAGVHHQEGQLKGLVGALLQLLHQLCQHHGVLSAGNADGNTVSRRNQLIPLYSGDKGVPKLFAVGLDETALGNLLRGQFTGHGYLRYSQKC